MFTVFPRSPPTPAFGKLDTRPLQTRIFGGYLGFPGHHSDDIVPRQALDFGTVLLQPLHRFYSVTGPFDLAIGFLSFDPDLSDSLTRHAKVHGYRGVRLPLPIDSS